MLVLFAIAFVTIAVFYFARRWAHRATLVVFGLVSKPLAEKLAAIPEKLADGLHVFGRGRDALGYLLETAIYWGLNAFGMWVLAWGCGVVHAGGAPITFPEACGLMGLLGCAILIPGPPGLLGVFQAGIYAGMTMFYPTDVVIGAGAALRLPPVHHPGRGRAVDRRLGPVARERRPRRAPRAATTSRRRSSRARLATRPGSPASRPWPGTTPTSGGRARPSRCR